MEDMKRATVTIPDDRPRPWKPTSEAEEALLSVPLWFRPLCGTTPQIPLTCARGLLRIKPARRGAAVATLSQSDSIRYLSTP